MDIVEVLNAYSHQTALEVLLVNMKKRPRSYFWQIGLILSGSPVTEETKNAFRLAFQNEDTDVRQAMVYLAGFHEIDVVTDLVYVLENDSQNIVRVMALWALSQYKTVESYDAIIRSLYDSDSNISVSANILLLQADTPIVTERLTANLSSLTALPKIISLLEVKTGQKFGNKPLAWKNWWKSLA